MRRRGRRRRERDAYNQSDALRIAVYASFRQNSALIEPHELHKTDLAYAATNHRLHFLVGLCGGHLCCEFGHVRPADRFFHRRDNNVKGLRRCDAPPLYVDLASLHVRFPQAWPETAGGPKVTAVVDVEIRLSARWRASPQRHRSAPHYAERRRGVDRGSCGLS